jgi:hypothetical protein
VKANITEYLVEALPVWRRATRNKDDKGANNADDNQVRDWDKLKEDDMVFEVETDDWNPIILHRTHPRFEQWTGAQEIFRQGLEPPEAAPPAMTVHPDQKPRPDVDAEDEHAATEMLGCMVDRLMGTTKPEDTTIMGTVEGAVFNEDYNGNLGDALTPHDAYELGRRYLLNLSAKDRARLAEAMLNDGNARILHVWTQALIIAQLHPEIILEAWRKNGVKE